MSSVVEVKDNIGTVLGKVRIGDTKLQALERLGRVGVGGLFDCDDVGLLDNDVISAVGAPYVFKASSQDQPMQQVGLDSFLYYETCHFCFSRLKSWTIIRFDDYCSSNYFYTMSPHLMQSSLFLMSRY